MTYGSDSGNTTTTISSGVSAIILQRATRLIQCGQAFGQKDVSIFRSILQREKTISRCAKQKQRLAYHVATARHAI